ncbi:MAG TPA: hypothetical protein DCS28_01305 [Candidatus Moranbacteria bacterium]|nr:hypothetical protein [Candidatus Moranbacteria bacterium]HAT74663.1 hypothetical protein [Candidatus Moranbacteria bacterium]
MQKYFEKIKKWSKDNWPVWILLLISATVYHKWLSFGIFTNADYWFYFSETSRDFLRYSAWDSQTGLGAPNLFLWMLGYKLFPGFLGFFGFDSNISDKFLVFWPFAFLTPFFAYLFAKQVLKNNFGAFTAACVFSFNTYYLAINTQGHFSLSLAGTFAPLAMYFFWRYFDSNKKEHLIASALVCLIVSSYDFRVFYILFFILFVSPFWFLFAQNGLKQKKLFLKNNFSAMALFFGLIFIFNLFWILPTAMTGSLASNTIVARPLVDNNFSLDLEKTLTLFHPFWNGNEPKWFDDQKIPLYFWLIPIMVLLGAFWNKKNKKIIFWFFIAIIAVFLSKQNADPLKNAYIWLHQNFPGFNAFREASKFYFAIALSYAILIGAFVKYIFEKFNSKLSYGVFIAVVLIFLWNAKPILIGEMNSIFIPQKIANDEIKIRDYVFSQDGSFRTLWVPSDSKWASYSAFRPKINAIETRRSDWKKIKDYADLQGGEPDGEEKNQLFFSENFATRLFSQSAVRYLLVNNQNYFMIENLVANPMWEKNDLKLENLQFFENQATRSRMYLTENIETIHRDNSFQPVDYNYENSSRWNFTIENSVNPVWINFSEKYHPDWQLVCGNFKWYDIFSEKSYLLPQKNHFQTDAGLNSFFINPSEIKEKCVAENNGKIALSFFYHPQAYLYLGGIISLTAVFISFIILVFWREEGHNDKVAQENEK